jgi:hypothetical protein
MSLRRATLTTSAGTATATNAAWNGAPAAGAKTTFGFLANGAPTTPAAACAVS